MSDFDDLFDNDSPEFYDTNEDLGNTSLYTFAENDGTEFFKKIFGNNSLKVGIVIKTYDIDDKNNFTKNVPEYDVLIVQQDETSIEPVIYRNCINTDSFGGKSDFFEYKLREVDNKKEQNNSLNTNFKDQYGNMVLLLCLDGSTDKGIILKSVRHPGRKTTLTKDAGLHLEGEYNGLNWQVNKDGEFTITFKSKTDNEGKPQDETAGGTHLKIDKKGSVDINTALEGDEETYIRMDKANKDIGLKAGQHIGFTAKQNIGMNADGEIKGKAKGAIEFNAEGAAKVSAKSALNLESSATTTLKGNTIMIKGSNLVQVDGQKLIVNSSKIILGSGGAPAVIATTKFLGVGAHGAQVVSSAIGPFSSTVLIAP